MEIAGGQQQVFPAVEIHIEEGRRPGPIGGRHARELGYLGPGAVAPAELKGVAGHLGAELRAFNRPAHHPVERVGSLTRPIVAPGAEHLGDEEIVVAVTVDVGRVHGHRRQGLVAQGEVGGRLESLATVEPQPVGPVDEIIAHVQVRLMVAVEVAEHHRQTPVPGGIAQGLSALVQKQSDIPRSHHHVRPTPVDVERVGFSPFQDLEVAVEGGDSEVAILRFDHRAAVGLATLDEPAAFGRIVEGVGAVVGDIHVEVAVAIDIGQGHRRGPRVAQEPHLGLGEIPPAVVAEGAGSPSEAVDEEVEVTVAVEVGEVATRGVLIRTRHPGPGGDVLEVPIPEIPVEDIVALEPAEIHVDAPIAIDIAQGDT